MFLFHLGAGLCAVVFRFCDFVGDVQKFVADSHLSFQCRMVARLTIVKFHPIPSPVEHSTSEEMVEK